MTGPAEPGAGSPLGPPTFLPAGDRAVTCSPERLAANRANALKSTGPKTPEGKAISRRNGLKHGLTGQGVALPDEDASEVERRFARFEAEMAPKTELGHALMLRAATLTVRLERCHRHEAARLGLAVDSAIKAYDDRRMTEVERLLDGIEKDPFTNARRLQATPEGVEHSIRGWQALADDLARTDARLWATGHRERAEALMGRRPLDFPRSRIHELSQALWFDFSMLGPGEAQGLDDFGKYEYARQQMAALVAGRIEALTGFLARMDLGAAERARAGAADRALFDASPESILARKYEAATERSLFRTLREFREVEAAASEAGPTSEPAETCEDLGSSLPETADDAHEGEAEPPIVAETGRRDEATAAPRPISAPKSPKARGGGPARGAN